MPRFFTFKSKKAYPLFSFFRLRSLSIALFLAIPVVPTEVPRVGFCMAKARGLFSTYSRVQKHRIQPNPLQLKQHQAKTESSCYRQYPIGYYGIEMATPVSKRLHSIQAATTLSNRRLKYPNGYYSIHRLLKYLNSHYRNQTTTVSNRLLPYPNVTAPSPNLLSSAPVCFRCSPPSPFEGAKPSRGGQQRTHGPVLEGQVQGQGEWRRWGWVQLGVIIKHEACASQAGLDVLC